MATLEPVKKITGRAVPIPGDDIDTDRIIPARFMKCVTFDGLGEYAFYDTRFNEDGSEKPHPLNEPGYKGASILLTGSNFGCGSSREHAPQSLQKFGIRGIIGESFAEIFFGNSCLLGIPCVSLSPEDMEKLTAMVEGDPQQEVTIDLEDQKVRCGGQAFELMIAGSAREALLAGTWDPIALMLQDPGEIDQRARALNYIRD